MVGESDLVKVAVALRSERDEARNRLSNIAKIIEIYFMPWGAAKPAMWEGLTGEDKLPTPEGALQYIKRELERN